MCLLRMEALEKKAGGLVLRMHDFYRDIVWIAVFCAGVFFLAGKAKAYWKEEKTYGFQIQSDMDLTAELVEEFRTFSGICRFEPVHTAAVRISLDSYTLETVLVGVEFGKDAMRFSSVQKNVTLGNVPKLLVGEEVFAAFSDKNGAAPTKSQIEKWIENYDSLELTMLDENGVERIGEISGIVKKPDCKIYMDTKQMYEVFGKEVRITRGYMEIYGYQNRERAKEKLEEAGFLVDNGE